MQVRCPKCKQRQEIPDASHNERVACNLCTHEFKAIGLETSELAEEVFTRVMEWSAARAKKEEEEEDK